MTTPTPPKKAEADLRERILEWLDGELRHSSSCWGSKESLVNVLRALRGEVSPHERRDIDSIFGRYVACAVCGFDDEGASLTSVEWPCPTLQRIASQLGVEP